MSRLDSLRGKIPRRPSRPDNASGQGRRRTKRQADPAVAAAGRALSDAREVFGDVPRDADADHLVRRARRLVRQAALDEFAREGVSLVQLPEQWGRAELRRADVPGDAAFQEFVGEVLAAIDIAPSSLERDDALELLHAPSSTDPYGLSLEVAADLASFLLSRAWLMERGAFAASAEAGERTGDAANPPGVHGDGPGTDAAATVGLPTQDEFVAGHATHIRDEVRAALVRVVKVPLELKEARDKHRRIAERIAAGGEGRCGTAGEADRTQGPCRASRTPGQLRWHGHVQLGPAVRLRGWLRERGIRCLRWLRWLWRFQRSRGFRGPHHHRLGMDGHVDRRIVLRWPDVLRCVGRRWPG